MRISSQAFGLLMTSTFRVAQQREMDLMRQMATGNRLLRPSDDPIAAQHLASLADENNDLTQYSANIDALSVRLQKAETFLGSATSDITQAHDLMLWAADGSDSPTDLNTLAQSLDSMRESLVATANARDSDGHYLFSGTKTDAPAVAYDPNAPVGQRYSFKGNTEQQQASVGDGTTAAGNVSLDEMAALLNKLDQAAATLHDPNVDPNDPATRAQMKDCLDTLDMTLESVSSKQARLGASRKVLETLQGNQRSIGLADDQATLQIGSVDIANASVELTGYQASVTAAQKIYGRVCQLSLFDVL